MNITIFINWIYRVIELSEKWRYQYTSVAVCVWPYFFGIKCILDKKIGLDIYFDCLLIASVKYKMFVIVCLKCLIYK